MANKPSIPCNLDPTIPPKDTCRAAVIAAICQSNDPTPVRNLLHEIASLPNQTHSSASSAGSMQPTYNINVVLDVYYHSRYRLILTLW